MNERLVKPWSRREFRWLFFASLLGLFGCAIERSVDDVVSDGVTDSTHPTQDTPSSSGSPESASSQDSLPQAPQDPAPQTPQDPLPRCTLTDSNPVTATHAGQIIENLRIASRQGPALTVEGFSNVTIRNVEIQHQGGPGIQFSHADNLQIENVSITHVGSPATGPNPNSGLNNIAGTASSNPVITRVRLTNGSSGIYLINCPGSKLSFVEGHDFRGPFPRGQLVQWDKSDDGLLEDFSVVNPPGSWPEDNVNAYESLRMQIRRGLVDGNNSPSGVGVIFDGGSSTGTVEDVDAIHMGNGCFSDYAGGEGIVFRRTRCRDNICGDQGRGTPGSNALMWCGHTARTQLRVEKSVFYAACNQGNIIWPRESFSLIELDEQDFTPRTPLDLHFCWE